MNLALVFLIEHDWIDKVNAVSTLVIAAFTVLMFFVVWNQLRTSKDTERSWVMPKITRDSLSAVLVGESKEGTKTESATQAAFLLLTLKNDGRSPVWVKHLKARLVLVDSVEKL